MDKETIRQMEPAVRKKYKLYEKTARSNIKRIKRKNFIVIWFIAFCLLYVFYQSAVAMVTPPREFELSRFLRTNVVCLAISFFITKSYTYILYGGKKLKEQINAENNEGFSDELLRHAYKINNSAPDGGFKITHKTVIATYHNQRGEFEKTVEVLSGISPDYFINEPTGSHMYFSSLIEAYCALGDMQTASKLYDDGLYYMNTYINSELQGAYIRVSLAFFEHCKGNYQTSVDLLTGTFGLPNCDETTDGKHNVNDEQFTAKFYYRLALSYFDMGNKEKALEYLKLTDGKRATPFFRECIDKLYKDLEMEGNTL